MRVEGCVGFGDEIASLWVREIALRGQKLLNENEFLEIFIYGRNGQRSGLFRQTSKLAQPVLGIPKVQASDRNRFAGKAQAQLLIQALDRVETLTGKAIAGGIDCALTNEEKKQGQHHSSAKQLIQRHKGSPLNNAACARAFRQNICYLLMIEAAKKAEQDHLTLFAGQLCYRIGKGQRALALDHLVEQRCLPGC
jgi:hypothetical protein